MIIKTWKKRNLIFKILCGIIVGSILGVVIPQATPIGYLGVLFVSALKAIAPILVFVLVMSSISQAGAGIESKFRNVILLYIISTLASAIVAVCVSFIFPLTVKLSEAYTATENTKSLAEIFGNLLQSVVENPVSALLSGNYLGILFWAIIIGFGLKQVANKETIAVVGNLSDAISNVVKWIIQFAPFGVMGIVFTTVSINGISIFTSYGKLILELVLTMMFVMLVSNPFIIFLCTRKNPFPLVFKCIRESAIPAFFTRSSAANIPVNMALCQRLGLDKNFYSVSIPLGSTINMNGAAVVITIMSLTLAHTLGVYVPITVAIFLAIISTLGACGTSGVAGGSLLLIPMACSFLGISSDISMQMVAVGFIVGVIQDSVETALNSSSDVTFTAVAEQMEEKKIKTET